MGFEILDGTGTGSKAKVSSNRLYTDTVERSEIIAASANGDGFNINTGTINLTSANKSAVMYVRNNESKDMVVESFIYLIGNSTGGSGDMFVSVVRNPTAGTIIDNAVVVDYTANRNFGSAKTLQADEYKGVDGDTVTDGSVVISSIVNQSPSRVFISASGITLPTGSSLAIEITPATGNTSLNVQVAIPCYLKD